jgi:hypothetical protein
MYSEMSCKKGKGVIGVLNKWDKAHTGKYCIIQCAYLRWVQGCKRKLHYSSLIFSSAGLLTVMLKKGS